MFTQLSLSLGSNNYIFKVKLNNEAIYFFKNKKNNLNEQVNLITVDTMLDIYEGEILGITYRDVSNEFMLKEMNDFRKFFESNGLTVYEPKITSLENRLKELDKMSLKSKEIQKTF